MGLACDPHPEGAGRGYSRGKAFGGFQGECCPSKVERDCLSVEGIECEHAGDRRPARGKQCAQVGDSETIQIELLVAYAQRHRVYLLEVHSLAAHLVAGEASPGGQALLCGGLDIQDRQSRTRIQQKALGRPITEAHIDCPEHILVSVQHLGHGDSPASLLSLGSVAFEPLVQENRA